MVEQVRVNLRAAGFPAPIAHFRRFGALTAVIFLVILAGFPVVAPLADSRVFDDYLLGAGDRLRITVAGHPRNSGEFDVDGLGDMEFPSLGRIRVRGRTVADLRAILRAALGKALDAKPEVTVAVLSFRPFFVYGEVKRAGSYPYVAGLTVGRAVGIAGGFTGRAQKTPVDLIRESRSGMVRLKSTLDSPMLPGDIIEVSRRFE